MFRLLLITISIISSSCLSAQDFITVKKRNGITVKTFFAGSPIIFETIYGDYVSGTIEVLRNDSLFIRFYDTRKYNTVIGSVIIDTVTSFLARYHYKEISRVNISRRGSPFAPIIGKLLMIGGGGYILLNLANNGYFHEPISSRKNLQSIGGAALAIGVGFLINKFLRPREFTNRRHSISYVRLQ